MCVLLQNQQVSIYIKRISENTATAPRALPCRAKTFSWWHFFTPRSLHTFWNSQAETQFQWVVNFLGEGKPPPSPCLKPLSTVGFSWEIPVRQYFNRDPPICLGSLGPRRVHPAASTSLLLSWNITVLHSQIKVSSISLLRGVKLGLLTSWMQQSGVAVVMSASVLGSIQLGIVFSPLFFGERG